MGGFTEEKDLHQGLGALGGDSKAKGAPSEAALSRAHFTAVLFGKSRVAASRSPRWQATELQPADLPHRAGEEGTR